MATKVSGLVVALTSLALCSAVHAQGASGAELVKLLHAGGYVIVMRHASSPMQPPAPANAEAGNVKAERQLDETGRKTATEMGKAIRALHIPIGEVWSSPTYRALETIRLAGLPRPKTSVELGDRGQSMRAAGRDQSAWLRAKVAEQPRHGTDTVLVTHAPNMAAAFGEAAANLTDGEALVFRPAAGPAPHLVGRIGIGDWPNLARSSTRPGRPC
jgi:phosphohistidine phosphatase SixA